MREIHGFSVRAVKVLERASEETLCFQADVYLRGKKLGVATNTGRGGCNDYSSVALSTALEAAAAQMPPVTIQFHGRPEAHTFKPDADYLVMELVDCARLTKTLQQKMKTRVVLTTGADTMLETRPIPPAELQALVLQGEEALRQAVGAKPGERVLNHLPIDEAVDLVRGPQIAAPSA